MTAQLLAALADWPGDDPTPADLLPGQPELHPRAAELLAKVQQVNRLRTNLDTQPAATTAAGFDPPLVAGDAGAVGDTFRLLGVLGEGGMGVVYEAEATDQHPRLRPGQRVALKVLRTDGPAAAEYLREAQAATAARHHHVIPVYEVGRIGDRPYLVMPRLAGETLEQRLQRQPRNDLGFILQIGRHTAAGLAAVHAAGYVHRDVKPANLWLEGWHDYLRVLDFGLARPLGDAPTGACGTPGYMAPEQMSGGPVDGRADLFSLGCVLYRTAAGLPAFGGATPLAVLRAVREDRPVPLGKLRSDLPAELRELVHAMLCPDPAGRPVNVAEVRAVLGELDAEARTRTPMPVRRTTGWLRYLGAESSRHAAAV